MWLKASSGFTGICIDCYNFLFCGFARIHILTMRTGSFNGISQLTLAGSDLPEQALIDHSWQFSPLHSASLNG